MPKRRRRSPRSRPAKPRVFLIDQPGAVQANIFAGELVPSAKDPGAVKFGIANDVLAGCSRRAST